MRSLGSWLLTLLMAISVLGVLALSVGPRLLGMQGLVVFTGSMQPGLQPGGLALLEAIYDPLELHPGDVITYRSPGDLSNLTTHRVTEVIDDDEGLRFGTKGDSNQLPDRQLIPAANLVGKVRYHVPYLGYVAHQLRHREKFYPLAGILVALVILVEGRNIAQEIRRQRQKPQRLAGFRMGREKRL